MTFRGATGGKTSKAECVGGRGSAILCYRDPIELGGARPAVVIPEYAEDYKKVNFNRVFV